MGSREILRSYLCDKGTVVKNNESLLEILKESLRNENQGIYSSRVENCTQFTVQTLPLDSIIIGNSTHFEKIEPREPYSPSGGPLITGVLVHSLDSYRIVDGYHRLKYSLENGKNSGLFIIISMKPI